MDGIGCTICPRRCGVPRGDGFCGAPSEPEVASVCLHRGEEPPLVGPDGKGIVNIFFAHCNLQCEYCQNWQISGRTATARTMTADEIADEVCRLLPQSSGLVGFVTAAHYTSHLPHIIDAIHRRGFTPTVVYNSGGYESVESLRKLEGLVDIYLPDLKYMDASLAERWSHAADYPAVAAAALREMKRQAGSGLTVGDGVAMRGIIVRHLVLPGCIDNSMQCLEWLADNFNPFSLHLSLMAQYFPPHEGLAAPLDRTLTESEYRQVVGRAEELALTAGWIQEMSAQENYRPDFGQADNPFER